VMASAPTSTSTPAAQGAQSTLVRVTDWVNSHRRELLIALGVTTVVAGGAGYYFYSSSASAKKEERKAKKAAKKRSKKVAGGGKRSAEGSEVEEGSKEGPNAEAEKLGIGKSS